MDNRQPAINSILCVEDDEDTCQLIRFVFEQADCEMETCGAQSDLKIFEERVFSAIILDNHFNGLSGVDICRRIRRFHPLTPVVFFSGESRQTEIEKAFDAGATAYLIKPNDFEKLVVTTLDLIKKAQDSQKAADDNPPTALDRDEQDL